MPSIRPSGHERGATRLASVHAPHARWFLRSDTHRRRPNRHPEEARSFGRRLPNDRDECEQRACFKAALLPYTKDNDLATVRLKSLHLSNSDTFRVYFECAIFFRLSSRRFFYAGSGGQKGERDGASYATMHGARRRTREEGPGQPGLPQEGWSHQAASVRCRPARGESLERIAQEP